MKDAQNDIGEIIDIAFGIREKRYLEEYVVPLIKKHLGEIEKLSLLQKTEILSVLSQTGEMELILTLIKNLGGVSKLNRFAVMNFEDSTASISSFTSGRVNK